jgi:hypothetical protein
VTPISGRALPVLGIVAFMDFNWNATWTSSAGYSLEDVQNSDGQLPSAYRRGHYVAANVLYHPVPGHLFLGPEIEWGRRENFSDGFSSDDVRIQFSAKYSFKLPVGGR